MKLYPQWLTIHHRCLQVQVTKRMMLLAAIQSRQNRISSLCVINGNGNESTRAPNNRQRQPYRPRRNTSKYCWSHDACAHDSSECQAKNQDTLIQQHLKIMRR